MRRSPVSTTYSAISSDPVGDRTVKIRALPPGRNSGQRWDTSFGESSVVNPADAPPAAEIRERPETSRGAKTIESSGPQRAPLGLDASASVSAGPPRKETFLSLPSAKKPSHSPSGEKKGCCPPSVPGMGFPSGSDRARRWICWTPPRIATYARRSPSGENARPVPGSALGGRPPASSIRSARGVPVPARAAD